MRNLILDYKYVPGQKTIDTGIKDLKTENIRLIVNETQHKIYCSSMQKQLVANILNGIVTIDDKFPPIEEGDKLTVEVDMGPGTSGAIEEELQFGKDLIASNIINKGGVADNNHSLAKLADDVLTIPTPETIEVPSTGSTWEKVCKAMWTSDIPYTYDIIAEYERIKELYINLNEPDTYHCAIICGYNPTEDYIHLTNANAYVVGTGGSFDKDGKFNTTYEFFRSDETPPEDKYFFKDGYMNNHYIIYLYQDRYIGAADFRRAEQHVAPVCMYAKDCLYTIKTIYFSDQATKGIFMDCKNSEGGGDYSQTIYAIGNSFCFNNTLKHKKLTITNYNQLFTYEDWCEDLISASNSAQFVNLYFPKLKKTAQPINGRSSVCSTIYLPELVESHNAILDLYDNKNIKYIIVPKLKYIYGNFTRQNSLFEELNLNNVIELNGQLGSHPKLKRLYLENLMSFKPDYNGALIDNASYISELNLPKLSVIEHQNTSGFLARGCGNISRIKLGKITKMSNPTYGNSGWFKDLPNLIDLEIGPNTATDLFFQSWIPNNVFGDEAKEKLIVENIKNNLIKNLATLDEVNKYTIYLSPHIKGLLEVAGVINSITDKNWRIG